MTYRLGLTGSIGMGKSTTAQMFADAGCAVWDADAAVHRLYAPGGHAVPVLAEVMPMVVIDGAVSRDKLKWLISVDPSTLQKIERFVHPLVAADRAIFAETATAPITVFDVPLLYETGGDDWMDACVVCTAPADVQRARVMARDGMTEAQFALIVERQMPDADKRARADHVIETTDMEAARARVAEIVAAIKMTLPPADLVADAPDA